MVQTVAVPAVAILPAGTERAGEISGIVSDLFSTHVEVKLSSQDYVLTETTKFRFAMNLETFQSIPAENG